MATARTILNRVLRTLGEEEIAATTTTLISKNHLLMLEFLNHMKEEVEESHNWRKLIQDLPFSVAGPAVTAAITGTDERSRLMRDVHTNLPLMFDITESTNEFQMVEATLTWIKRQNVINDEATSPQASWFAIDDTSDDTLNIEIYPKTPGTRNLQGSFYVPQAYIDADEIDVNILVPQRPLIMGTIWWGLEERGEELGVNAVFTEDRFRKALDGAIGVDAAAQDLYQLVPV